ncbi:site-2 protease family protein [Aquisphaera insulae]|uniref:site-2 protease family protein n=1 Tax=Aquisphaera insulae TaxID=2712864 RepID=UPI0013EAF2D8|nr:site-2 protease family protein [Aquisphaera insulae]
MFLAIPRYVMLGTTATPYDVRFRFLDIPVRIHPLFWGVTIIMGWRNDDLPIVALWVACVLISILVHEYGHGLMARWFGESPSILLYGLGGLCMSRQERTPAQRIAVLLAGPGAGFLLLGVVMAAMSLVYGITPVEHLAMVRETLGLGIDLPSLRELGGKLPTRSVEWFYLYMVHINLLWGLVNLLPIYPLDGGQITQVVMSRLDRRNGARRSHIVSLVTAGFLAVASFAVDRSADSKPDFFLLVFFGGLAMLNYQMLQSYHVAQSYGVDSNDDYWRN